LKSFKVLRHQFVSGEMAMSDVVFYKAEGSQENYLNVLKTILGNLKSPFKKGDSVGVKLHWGERGNRSYLPPVYAKEIAKWLTDQGTKPFVCDTTALYSGGRRTGSDAIKTAEEHGYTDKYLGCPIVIADGLDGRNIVDIPAGFKHFEKAQVASVIENADGFFIFSHFKGHMVSFFGGAIKNLSMGFASRAQKQRMHSDAKPFLSKKKCTRCGACVEICPTGAATFADDGYPVYNHETCIGCAQCIAHCPELALKILWETDDFVFQEKLVETAAAVWKKISGKSLFINALLNITVECDCLPGENPVIVPDMGFVSGYHPVLVDAESLKLVGTEAFERVHPNIPWQRQFEYSKEIGFSTQ
jgi:uncharacterized Fe-S center protein